MINPTPTDDPVRLAEVNQEVLRIQRHQQAKRYEEAGRAIDKLLDTYKDHPKLIHLKGLNLIYSGAQDEGLALLDMLIEHDNTDVAALVDYGSILAQSGKFSEAKERFQTAVEIAPNYVLAQANLGAVQVIEKDYARAIKSLTKALELDSSIVDAHLNLAQAYVRTHQFQLAVDQLFRVLAIDPQLVSAHITLANALFRLERHEAAEHHARRAIELAPDAIEAWLYLGNTLAAAGRIDEAVQALHKIANKPPGGLTALARLLNLQTMTQDSPEIALLNIYLKQIDKLADEQKSTLWFALGKASDDLGDAETAIGYFRKANALTAEMHPYNQALQGARHDRMRDLITPAFITKHRDAGLRDIAPIFICGMPRSGTTLMDQMFSRHPQAQAGGELRAVSYAFSKTDIAKKVLESELPDDALTDDTLSELAEHYIAYLHREGLKAEYVSDKMPGNYLYAGLLAKAMPRAKFLIMRRHPMDCLLSNFMQNFGQNQPFSTQIDNMVFAYTQFDKTAQQFTDLLPDQIRNVSYEDVVANPEGQMRSILDFAGLPFDKSVLDHTASMRQVNTASVSQVRQPIYATSVSKWHRYGPHLKDLAQGLRGYLSAEDLRICGLS